MRALIVLVVCLGTCVGPYRSYAQTAADTTVLPPAGPAEGSTSIRPASFSNPAISVIGWFQATAGNDPGSGADAFSLPEAELAFQSAVDPFSRADFILSAGDDGVSVEEGTLTWLVLPGGGQGKLGKFRADLGRFNRIHPGETPFADRPLAAAAFLGEDGLTTIGALASVLVPNPVGLYWDLIATVGSAPDSSESPVFQPESRSDLLALGRTSVFVPVGESADLALGASYANARARPALRGQGSRAQLVALDAIVRWKNPRRSIYRSLLLAGELIAEQGSGRDAVRSFGAYGYGLWQFARQWKLGARWDWSESPEAPDAHGSGALALVQFQPSEFSTVSLQGRRQRRLDAPEHDAVFLKWTFNIGPHGAHPY